MRSLVVALLAPAVFAAAPGWHTGHTGVHACPGSAERTGAGADRLAAVLLLAGFGVRIVRPIHRVGSGASSSQTNY